MSARDIAPRRVLVAAAAALAPAALTLAQPTVLRVDPAAPVPFEGSTWATAFTTINGAVAFADALPDSQPVELWIVGGTFTPTGAAAPGLPGDRNDAIRIDRPLTVRGGFAGTETAADQRPDPELPSAPQTVITGDINTPGVRSDNSYNLLVIDSFGVELERLTLTLGHADGSGDRSTGGGALATLGGPSFTDVRFVDNFADEGGGLFTDNGVVTLTRCIFLSNNADTAGGGAFIADGATLLHTVFDANSASIGGGLNICCGPILIDRSHFTGNLGTTGGGLFLGVTNDAVVRFTDVFDNAAVRGGGVYAASRDARIDSSRISSNTADEGGAVYVDRDLSVANSTFVRNRAFTSGGAFWNGDDLTLTHVTLFANAAQFNGGGVFNALGSTSALNSVFWANSDTAGVSEAAQLFVGFGSATADFSCIDGYTGLAPGTGSFAANPAFTDPAGPDGSLGSLDDDLSLSDGSPLIDAADGSALPPDLADLDNDGDTAEPLSADIAGLRRAIDAPLVANAGVPVDFDDGVPDVGAFELDPGCPADFNNDGFVDISDFFLLGSSFGQAAGSPADADGDGDTDISDFFALGGQFGADCTQLALP